MPFKKGHTIRLGKRKEDSLLKKSAIQIKVTHEKKERLKAKTKNLSKLTNKLWDDFLDTFDND